MRRKKKKKEKKEEEKKRVEVCFIHFFPFRYHCQVKRSDNKIFRIKPLLHFACSDEVIKNMECEAVASERWER